MRSSQRLRRTIGKEQTFISSVIDDTCHRRGLELLSGNRGRRRRGSDRLRIRCAMRKRKSNRKQRDGCGKAEPKRKPARGSRLARRKNSGGRDDRPRFLEQRVFDLERKHGGNRRRPQSLQISFELKKIIHDVADFFSTSPGRSDNAKPPCSARLRERRQFR